MSKIISNIISRGVTLSIKENMVKDKTSIVLIEEKRYNVMNVKFFDIFELNAYVF